MWLGSHINKFDPVLLVSNGLVELVPKIENNESGGVLYKKTKRRTYKEIYQMLNCYYRSHWLDRDAYWNKYIISNC